MHLTETYGDEQANSITNVETTHAAVSDDAVTETIHASLAAQHLLPEKHGADTGYVNAPLFVRSETTYGVELIGPTRGDNHWQAKEGGGYAARDVTIDWEHEQATCPVGNVSTSWTPAIDRFKNAVSTTVVVAVLCGSFFQRSRFSPRCPSCASG